MFLRHHAIDPKLHVDPLDLTTSSLKRATTEANYHKIVQEDIRMESKSTMFESVIYMHFTETGFYYTPCLALSADETGKANAADVVVKP